MVTPPGPWTNVVDSHRSNMIDKFGTCVEEHSDKFLNKCYSVYLLFIKDRINHIIFRKASIYFTHIQQFAQRSRFNAIFKSQILLTGNDHVAPPIKWKRRARLTHILYSETSVKIQLV